MGALIHDWIGGVTAVISFEQKLSVSLNARMAKTYSVSGSIPVIVARGTLLAWLSPEDQTLDSGSSGLGASETNSSGPDSSEPDFSGNRFP